VFEAVFPGCPVQLLGEGLPDRPRLPALQDPRQGPAAALRHWAGSARPQPLRWWIVACDQVRWTPAFLSAWYACALAADPGAERWVLARHRGRLQPLGGFLAEALAARLPAVAGASLMAFVDALPCVVLESEADPWLDLDTLDDHAAYLRGLGPRRPGS
jgi:molybdopterin-guanine dinucleotide biosynthesis protein A